jgi:hypothetical protein
MTTNRMTTNQMTTNQMTLESSKSNRASRNPRPTVPVATALDDDDFYGAASSEPNFLSTV